MDSNIKIIIATHKIYQMPQDPLYIPVQVGAEGKMILDTNAIILAKIVVPKTRITVN